MGSKVGEGSLGECVVISGEVVSEKEGSSEAVMKKRTRPLQWCDEFHFSSQL